MFKTSALLRQGFEWQRAICGKLFEDILKRGWQWHAFAHGKAKTIGLAGAVVRVLAKDDDFHFVERAEFKGAKDIFRRRINDGVLVLPFYEFSQLLDILFAPLFFQRLLPRRLNFYVSLLLAHGEQFIPRLPSSKYPVCAEYLPCCSRPWCRHSLRHGGTEYFCRNWCA